MKGSVNIRFGTISEIKNSKPSTLNRKMHDRLDPTAEIRYIEFEYVIRLASVREHL